MFDLVQGPFGPVFDRRVSSGLVNSAPVVLTVSIPAAQVGVRYRYQLLADGSPYVFTWSVSSGTLPSWLSVSSGGLLVGTPAAGDVTSGIQLRFTCSNGVAPDATSGILNLVVSPAAVLTPVVITRMTLPHPVVGVPYNQNVTTTGSQPITWNIHEGSLPVGLTLDAATGDITGTPTVASESQFIIRATNPQTTYENHNNHTGYFLKVSPYVTPPKIIDVVIPDPVVGLSYSFVFSAVGDSPITWSMTGALPAGLAWDAGTKTISGTPSASGTFNIRVTATNSNSAHSRDYVLDVQSKTTSRIYSDELTWVGSFKLPMDDKLAYAGGGYGGSGLAVTNRGTAFIATRREGGPSGATGKEIFVAEITIPALVKSTSVSALNRATFVQQFSDSSDGRSQELIAGGVNLAAKAILWKNNRIYVAASTAYEGNGDYANFYSRDDNLSSAGSIIGMNRVHGTHGARFFMGYLSEVPQRAQTDYGLLSTIAGGTLGSIVANGSMGPSMFNFNASTVANPTGPGDKVAGAELLGYLYSTNTGIDPFVLPGQYNLSMYEQNIYWSWGSTTVQGAAWLNSASKRAVLFMGQMGHGFPWYGEISAGGAFMTTDVQLSNHPTQVPDPVSNNKGPHAYPYTVYVWAYDEAEILKVKNSVIAPHKAKPYQVWSLDMPIKTASASIHGIAHDLSTRRIYVSLSRADMYAPPDYGTPIVHVFEYPN